MISAGSPSDPSVRSVGTIFEQAHHHARGVSQHWLENAWRPERQLLDVPDVGPACEVILADRLFGDLRPDEREGLLAWIRGSQDESGAWLDVYGAPDLSLTVLGWWARREAGDHPDEESMLRAERAVHAMGGAQRANFQVRLWLAMGGAIPWSFLPALPTELLLLHDNIPAAPSRFAPWARGILFPYILIARTPVRLQLSDPRRLLLRRVDGSVIAPRLTRPGLAGDLLQAFDRAVKLSRKLPRGPLPRHAAGRALAWLQANQQAHGGWFSLRPTLLSLIALRAHGTTSDAPTIGRGLDYLRRARGEARIVAGRDRGRVALAQGLGGPPLTMVARLTQATGNPHAQSWLLRHELHERGPWQVRADVAVGGWPREADGHYHLDLAATCEVLAAFDATPTRQRPSAVWGATRRATDVVLAMQEAEGGFARFERGETDVFMRQLPWEDADLLAFGHRDDVMHIRLTAQALHQLARIGFRSDDDRIVRGLSWLGPALERALPTASVALLSESARCLATLLPANATLRQMVERRLRDRQQEDGSFGTLVETARALEALVALDGCCVQVDRAARKLAQAVLDSDAIAPEATEQSALDHIALHDEGFGFERAGLDPSAAAREACLGLQTYLSALAASAAPAPSNGRANKAKRSK